MNQSMKQLAHKIVREKKNKLVLNLSENTSLVLRQGRVVALRHRFNTLKQSPLPEVQVECVELNGEAIGALQQASSSQCYSSNDDDEYLAYWEVINPDTLNKVVLYNLAAARKNPSLEFPEYALSLLENKTPANSLTLIYLDSVQQVFNGCLS